MVLPPDGPAGGGTGRSRISARQAQGASPGHAQQERRDGPVQKRSDLGRPEALGPEPRDRHPGAQRGDDGPEATASGAGAARHFVL